MAWGSVSWATNDIISLTKMNQMVDNNTFCYEETGAKTILTIGKYEEEDPDDDDITLYVRVDATAIDSHVGDGTAHENLNVDVSALTDGELHTIGLRLVDTYHTFKFYKCSGYDKLSYWVTTHGADADDMKSITKFVAILHRATLS